MSSSSWRLILDGPAPGAWNMGIDEALLRSAVETQRPTLRLYAWQGPWLSLGYAQRRLPEASRTACLTAGVGIVRRSTGGSAVLHGADLTYSVAAPESCLHPGLRGSHEQLSQALLAAIHAAGVPVAERACRPSATPRVRSFDCFAEPAGDEICVADRKLVGSAQRRRRGCVLQHGSIRMRADSERAMRAAGLMGEGATSLEELGCSVSGEVLRSHLVSAFESAIGARFEPDSLSQREIRQAHERVDLHAADFLSAPRPSRI